MVPKDWAKGFAGEESSAGETEDLSYAERRAQVLGVEHPLGGDCCHCV